MLKIILWSYAVTGTCYWLMRHTDTVEQYAIGPLFVLMWLAPVALAGFWFTGFCKSSRRRISDIKHAMYTTQDPGEVRSPMSMPTIEKFLAQLRDAGVTIINETEVRRQTGECGPQWTVRLTELARAGRRHGIAFIRAARDAAGDDDLRAILRGFEFTREDIAAFIASARPARDDARSS